MSDGKPEVVITESMVDFGNAPYGNKEAVNTQMRPDMMNISMTPGPKGSNFMRSEENHISTLKLSNMENISKLKRA